MSILYTSLLSLSTKILRFFEVQFIFVKGVQIMYDVFEQLLQKFGVTTYQVSKATGIGQSTFSSWKTRRNLISGEKAKKIADYFGVSVDYLMTGKEKEGGETYYLNDETKEIAQAIFENKELRMLFDVSRKASAERLLAYYNLIKAMQDTEKGND